MMPHTTIHRYRFSIAEVVEALGVGQDCAGWTITVDPAGVVVDIVEPGSPPPEPPPSIEPSIEEMTRGKSREEPHKNQPDAEPDFPADEQSGKTSPDPELDLKGGPLAQRAAICCGEQGFRTFLGVRTAEEAKADLCRRCGITSRKQLDHDDRAAEIWREIDGKYRLWLEGHDVEI